MNVEISKAAIVFYRKKEWVGLTEDDDLNNVRYKAKYRYETKPPLTAGEIIDTCDAWVVDDIGAEEVIKIVRRTEQAHGIGVENE
jgi:hypothetical protein